MRIAFPRGLKPLSILATHGTTEQVAEKDLIHGKTHEKHPSAAKAGIDFAAFTARLKSCPFKESAPCGVFPQPAKSCPFQATLFQSSYHHSIAKLVSQRLASLERVGDALLSFGLAAEGEEGLAFQVENVLLADQGSGGHPASGQYIGHPASDLLVVF